MTESALAAGRGRSAWIDGGPGIGKTAFLAEALGRLDVPGGQLFTSRTEDTVDFFPLRALLDALRIHPGVTDPDRAEIADGLWGRGPGDTFTGGQGQLDAIDDVNTEQHVDDTFQ